MSNVRTSVSILVADDDPDDRLMLAEALDESQVPNELHMVEDGEELLEYLRCEGRYVGRTGQLPSLILLDLNMPRLDGREALEQIKRDPALRRIPVVVLTTSRAEEDIFQIYDLGVNSFITKPVSFDDLVRIVSDLGRYWLEIVELPSPV